LSVLPIASCGLKLDDEVRVAVGFISFVSDINVVDARGLHSFVCKRAGAGQQGTMPSTTWLLALLPQLECPSQRSMSGCPGWTGSDRTALHSSLGGAGGCCATVICPLAESYVNGATCEASSAEDVAASRKDAELGSRYLFEPIAVETLGVFNSSANNLLNEIRLRMSLTPGSLGRQLLIPTHLSASAALQCHFVA